MEKRKKRFWSLILSAVMIVGLLWAVPGNGNAAAEDLSGVWIYSGNVGEVIDDDGYVMQEGKKDGNPTCKVTELTKLISEGTSGIYISGGKTVGNIDNTQVDATEGEIAIADYNVLECNNFEGVANVATNGVLKCKSFKGSIYNDGSFSCDNFDGMVKKAGSYFYVTSSFNNTYTENVENIGTIKVDNGKTMISSAGGTFKLSLDGREKTLSGQINKAAAWTLMDPDSSLMPEITISGENISSKIYVRDSVTISTSSGYFIGLDKASCTSNSITIDANKYSEIIKDTDYKFVVSKSDYSSYNLLNVDEINEGFKNIVFDSDAPSVSATFVADGKTISTPTEGGIVKAKELSVTINAKDDNLLEIVVYGRGEDEPITATSSEFQETFDFTADKANVRTFGYMVYDKSQNVSSLEFELEYAKDDFSGELTMSNKKYGDSFSNPDITGWDGEKTYQYIHENGTVYNEPSTTMPAGKYTAYATLTGSPTYNDTELTADFEIERYTFTSKVVVSSSDVIQNSYEMSIARPNDWVSTGGDESKIIKEYKKATDDDTAYTTESPSTPGTYVVRATLPETAKYKEVYAVSDPFEISKATLTQVQLNNVDSIEAGGTFKPNLSVDTTYDGKITYRYKLESESTYSDDNIINDGDVIKDAGVYTAKAIIEGSDIYEATESNEVSFTVSKKTVSLEVSADDVLVGETVNPVITSPSAFDPELDVDITYEYKGKGEGEIAYTSKVPTKAGDYTVKATITGSKRYEDARATTTFTIGKKTPSNASVIVSDIKLGGTITPVVTTDSDGKDSATYEYKKKDDAESAYSATVPTDTGDYSIRATIPETDTYSEIKCEGQFSIGKIDENTAKVQVPDTVVGTDYEPVLTTMSDGKSSTKFEYKPVDAEDSAYSETKPTAPGKYMIKATVPATDNYTEQTCTAEFNISKKTVSEAKVIINSTINPGEEVKPSISVPGYDGSNSPLYEYKQKDAADDTYTSEVPEAPGNYTVRATIAESDEWEMISCTADFTISEPETPSEEEKTEDEKSEETLLNATAKVEVADVYVGVSYEPILTTDSDGKANAVFEYRNADDKDAEFSTDKPVKAGKYIVRATVPKTTKYNEVKCESTFTISKITAKDSKVEVGDVIVGMDYNPVLTTDSDGKADAVFEYKMTSDKESAYSKTKPTKEGKYSVRATVPETDKYLKVVCEGTFSIEKKTPEASVKLSDQYAGTKNYTPTLSTDSDGKSKAYFEYKKKDASDDEYSKTKPTKAGEYVVRATIPETDKYKKATCETEFSIIYLNDNKLTYKVTGESGKNGFYVSDVYLAAPRGYEISSSRDGIYSKRIKYSSDIKKVYLRRESDGAQAEEILINNEIKVDKDSPKLVKAVDENNDKIELSGSNDLYADKLTLSFEDEHIISVKVNGQFAAPNDKNITIELDSEGGEKFYEVVVEDLAGNQFSSSITLSAAWMRDNTLPSGSKVRLRSGNGYKLNSGSWKVEGDATVYSGGRMVYVNSDGDYIFEAQ